MPPTLEHRLRELSHEELIRLLLAVAGTAKNVAAFLMQETTTQKEKVAAIKRGISALTRVGSGRIRVPARKVAEQILDLLRRIQSVAEQDAPTAYELMCRLLATESDISEHVDDSHGTITDAFRGRVVPALVAMTQRVTDHKTLLKSLGLLCKRDEVGTSTMALQQLAEYLPDATATALVMHIAAQPPDIFEVEDWQWDPHAEMIKAIHAGRGDIDAYLAAVDSDDLSPSEIITLARLHLDHDDLKGAEGYLSMLNDFAYRTIDEARMLRRRWAMHSTDNEAVERLCRIEIMQRPTRENLDFFRQRFGDAPTQQVLQSCALLHATRITEGSCEPDVCAFLIREGHADPIANAFERHPRAFTGRLDPWYDLMDALAQHGHARTSVVLCRRTLDQLANDADSRYYWIIAELYHRLPGYSASVTTWGPLPHHDHYIRDFADAHQRKHRMWEIINTWKGR